MDSIQASEASWKAKCEQLEDELSAAKGNSDKLQKEMKSLEEKTQRLKVSGGGDAPSELNRRVPSTPMTGYSRISAMRHEVPSTPRTPAAKPPRAECFTPLGGNARVSSTKII